MKKMNIEVKCSNCGNIRIYKNKTKNMIDTEQHCKKCMDWFLYDHPLGICLFCKKKTKKMRNSDKYFWGCEDCATKAFGSFIKEEYGEEKEEEGYTIPEMIVELERLCPNFLEHLRKETADEILKELDKLTEYRCIVVYDDNGLPVSRKTRLPYISIRDLINLKERLKAKHCGGNK